ncbi:MAG: hemerythrin domain-containing protein [Pseudonocardia sp.]|nr:hemerythrin domain-containing protein [Pseudonocardia sp.]
MSRPAPTAALPDLTGLRLLHRVMRGDLHRLTALAEQLAHLRAGISEKRAKAIDRWVAGLCAEIHHHHDAEDAVAWPVITRHAGAAVDLTGLSDDHAALDPLLDDLRAASRALVAAWPDELPMHAERLATSLRRLRDELDEHIVAEESEIFPVIEEYVPADTWAEVTKGVRKRKGGPSPTFQVPRIEAAATPAEMASLRAEAGPVLMMLLAAMRPGHRRREALVFGA